MKHLLLSIFKGRIHDARTSPRPLLPRRSTVCHRHRRIQARFWSTSTSSIILQPGKVNPPEVWRKLQVRLNLAKMGMPSITPRRVIHTLFRTNSNILHLCRNARCPMTQVILAFMANLTGQQASSGLPTPAMVSPVPHPPGIGAHSSQSPGLSSYVVLPGGQ